MLVTDKQYRLNRQATEKRAQNGIHGRSQQARM